MEVNKTMARVLPNSRINRKAHDADVAYNRAVNRGSDNDTVVNVTQVDDQPVERFPNRFRGDTAGQG